jgi:YjbR protein
VTADDFPEMALALPDTTESSHMRHPDFRVGGKIFATLGAPDSTWGMVKLTCDEQEAFIAIDPGGFRPVPGGWGRRGATNVLLARAKRKVVADAIAAAWRGTAGAKGQRASASPRSSKAGSGSRRPAR